MDFRFCIEMIVLLCFSQAFIACDNDGDGGMSSAPVGQTETIYGLGECNATAEGKTKLVSSENQYYLCSNGKWSVTVAPFTDSGTISGDMLYDARDGKTYRTVTFGTQTWMAENMNYDIVGSFCYNFDQVNCDLYGRLYTISLVQNVCPKGWHLPKYEDWETLREFFGGEKGQVDLNFTSSLAGYFQDDRFERMNEVSMLYGGIDEDGDGEVSALWMSIGRCVNDVSIKNGDGFYVRCIKY